MKAAYKWRLDGSHNLWLIDPKNIDATAYTPIIYDKETNISFGEEQNIKNIVALLTKDEYKDLFYKATELAKQDYSNLKFLDVDYYYNLKADGCLARQSELTVNDIILKASAKVEQIDGDIPQVDIDYSKQTAYEKNLDFTFKLPKLKGDYLPLSGGTIDGDLKITAGNNENPVIISDSGIYPQVNGSRTIGRGDNYFDVGYILKQFSDSVVGNDFTIKNKIDFRPNYTDPELNDMGINLDSNGFYPTKNEKYNIGKKTNKFYEVCSKDIICNNIIPDNYYTQNVTLIGKEMAPFNEIHVAKVQMYETEPRREDEGLKPIKESKIVCANGTTIDGIYYNTFNDFDQYPDIYTTKTFSTLYNASNSEILYNYGVNVESFRTIDYLPLSDNSRGKSNAQLAINTEIPAVFWRNNGIGHSKVNWKDYFLESDKTKTESEDGYLKNKLYGAWISFNKTSDDKKYQIEFKDGGEIKYKNRIEGKIGTNGLWLYRKGSKPYSGVEKYYGTIKASDDNSIYYVEFEKLPKGYETSQSLADDYDIYFSPYNGISWTKWTLAQAEPFCEYPIVEQSDDDFTLPYDPLGRKYASCIPNIKNDYGHVKFAFMKITNDDVQSGEIGEELEKSYFTIDESTGEYDYWANTIIMRESPDTTYKLEGTNQFKNKDNKTVSIFGVSSPDNLRENPKAFIGYGKNEIDETERVNPAPEAWRIYELVTNVYDGNVTIKGNIKAEKSVSANTIESKTSVSAQTVNSNSITSDNITATALTIDNISAQTVNSKIIDVRTSATEKEKQSVQNGNIYADIINSNEGFFEKSDARLKNIIGNAEFDIDKILNLSIIYFTFKDDKDNKVQLGVIAQEIAQICPEIVTKDKDGYLSVDYAKMSLLCLYCIKDLYGKIKK